MFVYLFGQGMIAYAKSTGWDFITDKQATVLELKNTHLLFTLIRWNMDFSGKLQNCAFNEKKEAF